MTSVLWDEVAINAVAGYLKDDAGTVAGLMQRIADLGRDPRPPDASRLGDGMLYRLRDGRYRVVYAIQDAEDLVTVLHVGRTG
jgi:mRNA-degrading endonuclease RelE of RelBE toxin-antitoxin system